MNGGGRQCSSSLCAAGEGRLLEQTPGFPRDLAAGCSRPAVSTRPKAPSRGRRLVAVTTASPPVDPGMKPMEAPWSPRTAAVGHDYHQRFQGLGGLGLDQLPVVLTVLVMSVVGSLLGGVFERRWFPLAKPGSDAHAWIRRGRSSKRGLVATSELNTLVIRVLGEEPVEYPATTIDDPLRPTWREALRIGPGYSVKLDCGRLDVFLREQDWKTLRSTSGDASGRSD